MYKILVVEDDMSIAGSMKKHLESWGYEVECAEDFNNVIKHFSNMKPHMVLMDISLPFFNGFHWCTEIRRISKVPIIFISSASDNMNIVMAVNMGGDDFIAKPFDINVLTAKIQAMIRRTYSFTGQTNFIEYKDAVLDMNNFTLLYKGITAELTKNEFKILQILFENPGKIISRDTIMSKLWESENFIDDNTLTVNVTRLRRKLEETGMHDYIKTKKGVGYILE